MIEPSQGCQKQEVFKYIGEVRKTRENVGSLLNKTGDIVTQDTEKAEVLDAFFASVLISKTDFQESQVSESRKKA